MPLDSTALINAGVYVLEPEILDVIPADEKVSLERTVFPSFLQGKTQLNGYESDGFFIDIGTPEGYYRFCNYVRSKAGSVLAF
jgi:mannose-1-phosphate guanylyltransferase